MSGKPTALEFGGKIFSSLSFHWLLTAFSFTELRCGSTRSSAEGMVDLASIADQMKMSREHALLGNYEAS